MFVFLSLAILVAIVYITTIPTIYTYDYLFIYFFSYL